MRRLEPLLARDGVAPRRFELRAALVVDVDAARQLVGVDAALGGALHARVAADGNDAGLLAPDVAARQRQVHHHLHVVDAERVLRQPHRVEQHRALRRRRTARRSARSRRAAARRRRSISSHERARASSRSSSKPTVRSAMNFSSNSAARVERLEHAEHERDVAARPHGEEVVHERRAQQRRLRHRRHPVAIERRLAERVDDDDARPLLLGEVQVLRGHRLVVREVGADEHEQIGADHVGERAGRRAPADGRLQARRRRRVAQPRAAVDVGGAGDARQLLRWRSRPRW